MRAIRVFFISPLVESLLKVGRIQFMIFEFIFVKNLRIFLRIRRKKVGRYHLGTYLIDELRVPVLSSQDTSKKELL